MCLFATVTGLAQITKGQGGKAPSANRKAQKIIRL